MKKRTDEKKNVTDNTKDSLLKNSDDKPSNEQVAAEGKTAVNAGKKTYDASGMRVALGLILFIVSALAVVCVITGGTLFSAPGQFIKDKLLGVFGAYAYVFLVYVLTLGAALIAGKRFFKKHKAAFVFFGLFVIFAFFTVHLAMSFKNAPTLNEEFSRVMDYEAAGLTAGGALASAAVYPLVNYLSETGAYIILVILSLLFFGLLLAKPIRTAVAKSKAAKLKKAEAKANAPKKEPAPAAKKEKAPSGTRTKAKKSEPEPIKEQVPCDDAPDDSEDVEEEEDLEEELDEEEFEEEEEEVKEDEEEEEVTEETAEEETVEEEAEEEEESDEFFENDDFSNGYTFISGMPLEYNYNAPSEDLLVDYTPDEAALAEELKRQEFCKEKIKSVFAKKHIEVEVVNVVSGSSVTRYDVAVPDDVSLKEIRPLQSDLEFRLQATGAFRMYCIPDSELIGIEVASRARRTVGMLNVFNNTTFNKLSFVNGVKFMLGEDILGDPIYLDLTKMPHLLISGATGTGKSVCLNTMLVSLLYNYSPEDLRLVLVDPKRVEFKPFEHIPHLVFDEILGFDEDGNTSKAAMVLDWAVQEMERRYAFLASRGFKNVMSYNKSIDTTRERKIPYLVIIIDEFADFIISSPDFKKSIELSIGRLAQKARAAGVSLILATQRPSVDVISGVIKTNIPSRICFRTATPIDSRVVIDDNGADKLLSKGDCLFKTTENSMLTRAQGAYISESEIDAVTDYIKANNECYYNNTIVEKIKIRAAKSKK